MAQTAGNITFSGSLRARLYGWDWFQPISGDNNFTYSGNLLRLGISQKRSRWDWNAEFGAPFLLGLPSNAIGTGPQQGALGFGANYFTANGDARNAAMVFPKQLYVRFNGIGGDQIDDDVVILCVDHPFVPEGRVGSLMVRDRALAKRLADGFESLWSKAMRDLREISFQPVQQPARR